MAVLLDQPFGVVAGRKGADGASDLVDGLEDAAVDGLLFQRAEEALDDAIRFRLADEGVARRQAPEPGLSLDLACLWKSSAMKLLPWSWRSATPRAAPAERRLNC